MKNDTIVCDDCFERICRMDAGCGRVWIDLCMLTKGKVPVALHIDEFEELRILEIMGYIVTTECPGYIMIRVKGSQESFFCNGACDD